MSFDQPNEENGFRDDGNNTGNDNRCQLLSVVEK